MLRALCVLFLLVVISGMVQSQYYWEKSPYNPILGPTSLILSFEQYHAFNPAVIKEDSLYRIWYNGYNNYTGFHTVGHVRSRDGQTWDQRSSSPVLDVLPGSEFEAAYLRLSCVVKLDVGYRMYYQAIANGIGVICSAISPDGIAWTRDTPGPVLLPSGQGWDSLSVGTPWVVKFGPGDYRMWYAGAGTDNTPRIGYALSDDGVNWARYPGNPILDVELLHSWEARMVSTPKVVAKDGLLHMFYMGVDRNYVQRLGYATSSDGISWTRASATPVLQPSGSESTLGDHSVICEQDSFKLWYSYAAGLPERWLIGFAATPIKPLGVGETPEVPQSTSLDAYPNPFNPGSVLRFTLPLGTAVTLDVYDILGKHVGNLANGRYEAGVHEVRWNAERLASGVYVAVLRSGGASRSTRLLLTR